MKNKKRKIKKKNFIILIIIIIIIIVIINYNNSSNLEKKGYSNLEISEINKLSKEEIRIINNYKYNENLLYIVNSDLYEKNNLELYLKYYEKYENIDYLKLMNLVNNENFNNDNINEYIEYINYDNINGIIKYVNEYKDKNIKLNNTILNFIEQQYFIYDNLNRYLKYYENNNNLSYKEIISRINSNIDYKFYDDSKKADIDKEMYTLVNKYNYLDKNYIPDTLVNVDTQYVKYSAKLVKIAYDNFIKMAEAAKANGLTLKITTGYRDYNFQSTLYNNYVATDGVKNADTYSARPGYSEHQLGYSMDLTNKNNVSFNEFENTDEYIWLQDNAYKYGFIMRYPKDKEYLTGYVFESWHYRYVGIEIATYIHDNDITYEEYYEYFLK